MEMGIFSIWSVPRSCLEDNWAAELVEKSAYGEKTRRVWCEMVTSLGVGS
jgi:hypothetical protein